MEPDREVTAAGSGEASSPIRKHGIDGGVDALGHLVTGAERSEVARIAWARTRRGETGHECAERERRESYRSEHRRTVVDMPRSRKLEKPASTHVAAQCSVR